MDDNDGDIYDGGGGCPQMCVYVVSVSNVDGSYSAADSSYRNLYNFPYFLLCYK